MPETTYLVDVEHRSNPIVRSEEDALYNSRIEHLRIVPKRLWDDYVATRDRLKLIEAEMVDDCTKVRKALVSAHAVTERK